MLIMDVVHLGGKLKIKPKTLSHMSMSMDENVSSFDMKKIQGSHVKIRRIYAPSDKLKVIQRSIVTNLLRGISVHDCAHGFVPGRGILTNAKCHYGRRTVINIDIKDFFPSITSDMVFDFWVSECVNPVVAYVLTKLTTYNKHLSQGFVTSPDISNRILFDVDMKIDRMASRNGLIYTRYADDITLSTDRPISPAVVISDVTSIVESGGFKVNQKKTKVMRPGKRQEVTGLVVNETSSTQEPRIKRSEMRMIRAMCHKGDKIDPEKLAERDGWMSFLSSIDPARFKSMCDIINRNTGKDK